MRCWCSFKQQSLLTSNYYYIITLISLHIQIDIETHNHNHSHTLFFHNGLPSCSTCSYSSCQSDSSINLDVSFICVLFSSPSACDSFFPWSNSSLFLRAAAHVAHDDTKKEPFFLLARFHILHSNISEGKYGPCIAQETTVEDREEDEEGNGESEASP
jgi:hypothetical protein